MLSATDLGAWLAEPARLPPWHAHPHATAPMGRSRVVVQAVYLGLYAAPWLSSEVARTRGAWRLSGSVVGRVTVALHAAERLEAAAEALRARTTDGHAVAVAAVTARRDAAADEVDRMTDPDALAAAYDRMVRAEEHLSSLRRFPGQTDHSGLGSAARLLSGSAEALVSSASYRAAFLASLQEHLPVTTEPLAPASDRESVEVLAALVADLAPGALVRRSAVNAALREAGLDLLDTDTDAAAATVGLLRPNRSGRIGGLHVYRLQEAPA